MMDKRDFFKPNPNIWWSYENTTDRIQPDEQDDQTDYSKVGLIGWICPVCGRGLSPFTSFCPCRGYIPSNIEITC